MCGFYIKEAIMNLVIEKLKSNEKVSNISNFYKLSKSTVYHFRNKYIKEGDNYLYQKRSSPVKKTNLYEKSIIFYVSKNPICRLKDISDYICNNLHVSSIYKILSRNKIERKKSRLRTVFKSEEEIKSCRKNTAKELNFDEFKFGIHIDETSFCTNDFQKYGYAVKGKRIEGLKFITKKPEKYTLLQAISWPDKRRSMIIKGSANALLYSHFFEENKDFFYGKHVYQDNVRFHHSNIVKKCAGQLKIKMHYNPPYSPEFNPIEMIFSVQKESFRRMNHIDIVSDIEKTFEFVGKNVVKVVLKALHFIGTYL